MSAAASIFVRISTQAWVGAGFPDGDDEGLDLEQNTLIKIKQRQK